MEPQGRTLCIGLRWLYPLIGACADIAMVAGLATFGVMSQAGMVAALIVSTTVVYAVVGALASRRILRLAECAARDELTHLWNRAEGLRALDAQLSTSSRLCSPLAVFMIDLDLLKQINDTGGHSAGDQALVLLGESLRRSIRCSDVAARFGGDEFLLVTPCRPEDALMLAERIRTQLMKLAAERGGRDLPTVSIGVAAVDGSCARCATATALLDAADRALYESKHNGRDRATLRRLAPAPEGGEVVRWPGPRAVPASWNLRNAGGRQS